MLRLLLVVTHSFIHGCLRTVYGHSLLTAEDPSRAIIIIRHTSAARLSIYIGATQLCPSGGTVLLPFRRRLLRRRRRRHRLPLPNRLSRITITTDRQRYQELSLSAIAAYLKQ